MDSKINVKITHINGIIVKDMNNTLINQHVQEKDKQNELSINEKNKNKKKKKKDKIYKNKCNCVLENNKKCKKKLTDTQIITNTCRCGLVFCNKHKGLSHHVCTYDYKNKLFKGNGLGGGTFKQVEII